jgi:glycine hydroxymethyltransferase
MYRLVNLASKRLFSVVKLRIPLAESDTDIFDAIQSEKARQFTGVNLIASENYCSNACMEAVGSIFGGRDARGYPGTRTYGGGDILDKLESVTQKRALQLFGLSEQEWGVNVQAQSGSPANLSVYTALLNPHDRIMSLDLPHGGHLSHGFQVGDKKISATSKYFEVFPYRLEEKTERIDYESLHKAALLFEPKLIVTGASAYSRLIDYKKFREIADEVGAILLCDMAHPAGLIAAGVIPSPFPYSDVVTTTTHKTLRGVRGSLIFSRIGSRKDSEGNEVPYDYKTKIDLAVSPGLQGAPDMHTIAGIAVGLREALSPEYKEYMQQVNAILLRFLRTVRLLVTTCWKEVSEWYPGGLTIICLWLI